LQPRILTSFLLATLGCGLRGAVRPDPGYRSQEAYGPARWGMTSQELRVSVPDLATCGAQRFCREELLKGQPALVSYELQGDHLIRVRLEMGSAAPMPDFARLEQDLTQAYGPPVAAARSNARSKRDAGREVMADLVDLFALFGGQRPAVDSAGDAARSQPSSGSPLSAGVHSLVFTATPGSGKAATIVRRWATPESELELLAREHSVELRLASRTLLHAG
jgi:hypothetical protein